MTINKRRNFLFKSSISIRSIGKSVENFTEGLRSARKNTDDIIRTTRDRNLFKSKLIRKDNEYFRKRQENVRRKNREDELEASSVQGVPKTQGSILAQSTRGFLGRILDFLGILLIGWAIQNLPRIIQGIQGIIKRISTVTGVLGLFVEGIQNILGGIGTMISETISRVLRLDFQKQRTDIDEGLAAAEQGIFNSRNELVQAGNEFANSENFGLENPPGFDVGKGEENKSEDDKKADQVQDLKDNPELQTQIKELENVVNGIAPGVVEEEQQDDDEVIEGDVEDVEGVLTNELEEEGGGSDTQTSGAAAGGSVDGVKDPTNDLKKVSEGGTEKKEKRGIFSFLGFGKKKEVDENKEISSNDGMVDLGTTRGGFSLVDGFSKEDKDVSVTPVKKDVNIARKRKSNKKIIIIETPVQMGSSSFSMPSGGKKSGSSIARAVSEEKILMNMQSTSTLKYT